MEPLEWILLGVALTAIPAVQLSRVLVAFLASKAGVSAREIEKYQDATDGRDDA